LTPYIIVIIIIVEMEQVVKPVKLNPPRQFALVISLELILLVLVKFVLIRPVLWMSTVMSRYLLIGVSRKTATVIFIVIMVGVLFRTVLHITEPANVITAKLQIIVDNLVEMSIATVRNPV